jgi:hypothetical protein
MSRDTSAIERSADVGESRQWQQKKQIPCGDDNKKGNTKGNSNSRENTGMMACLFSPCVAREVAVFSL